MAREVDFGGWLNQAFDLYKRNFGLLVLTSLLTLLISSLTIGILAGPMMAGMILISLRLLRGQEPKPEVGTLFEGFNHFLPTFLFVLIWGALTFVIMFVIGLIPCLGQILAPVLGLAVMTLLMFAMFLIVDRGQDFWPASMASIEAVKPAFWPLLGYMVVISILGQIGALACLIGMIFTYPILICGLAVAYESYLNAPVPEAEATIVSEPPPPATEPPPPPPGA